MDASGDAILETGVDKLRELTSQNDVTPDYA